MRYAQGHAQCGLPIALQFVVAEIAIPADNTVQFADHPIFVHLTHNRLYLLGGGVLIQAAEHIHAGHLHTAIATHSLAGACHGIFQRVFCHQMPAKVNAVFFTPCANRIKVSARKKLGNMVIKLPADAGISALWQIPYQFRQSRYDVHAVCFIKGNRQQIRPRQDCCIAVLRCGQGFPLRCARFIGKDGWHRRAEFVSEFLLVFNVRHGDKALHRLRVQGINVCRIGVALGIPIHNDLCQPFGIFCRFSVL